MIRIIRQPVLVFCLSFLVFSAMAGAPLFAQSAASRHQNTNELPYTISPATTFVTGPLREDGTIDFVAALDKEFSRGVTDKNNAALVILPLLESVFSRSDSENSIRSTEVDPEPGKDRRFSSMPDFLDDNAIEFDELFAELKLLEERRFAERYVSGRAEYRMEWVHEADDWFDSNTDVFRAFNQGTRRDRWFVPMELEIEDGSLLTRSGSIQWAMRDFSKILGARALLLMDEGRYEDSWDQILAIQRLGRLTGEGFDSISSLHAEIILHIANNCAAVLVQNDAAMHALDPQVMLDQWQTMRPSRQLIRQINWYERLVAVQWQTEHAQNPKDFRGTSARLTGMEPADVEPVFRLPDGQPFGERFLEKMLTGGTDRWDAGLRLTNQVYDSLVKSMKLQSTTQQLREIQRGDEVMDAYQAEQSSYFLGLLAGSLDEQHLGEGFAKIYLPMLHPVALQNCYEEFCVLDCQKVIAVALAIRQRQKSGAALPNTVDGLQEDLNPAIRFEYATGNSIGYSVDVDSIRIWQSDIDGKRRDQVDGDDWVVTLDLDRD